MKAIKNETDTQLIPKSLLFPKRRGVGLCPLYSQERYASPCRDFSRHLAMPSRNAGGDGGEFERSSVEEKVYKGKSKRRKF